MIVIKLSLLFVGIMAPVVGKRSRMRRQGEAGVGRQKGKKGRRVGTPSLTVVLNTLWGLSVWGIRLPYSKVDE